MSPSPDSGCTPDTDPHSRPPGEEAVHHDHDGGINVLTTAGLLFNLGWGWVEAAWMAIVNYTLTYQF